MRAAWARNQAEAELIQGLLLEEGIPSLARRSGGFDVPDFLAAGPRDVMVAAGGLDAAREILGDPWAPRRLPAERHPAWMRALAFTLAFTVLIAFAASVAVPFFDWTRAYADSATRETGQPREVAAPRALGVADRARERDLERADRPVGVRPAGQRHARAVALLAREQVEDRAAEQQRVGARGRKRRLRDLRAGAARRPGRTWRVCPDSHCAAPSTSHAQRFQRAEPARA